VKVTGKLPSHQSWGKNNQNMWDRLSSTLKSRLVCRLARIKRGGEKKKSIAEEGSRYGEDKEKKVPTLVSKVDDVWSGKKKGLFSRGLVGEPEKKKTSS